MTNVIQEAINKIVSTSEALEWYCGEPENYNMAGTEFIEMVAWQLQKSASELSELRKIYGF